jgi:hypothetical protein
VLLDKHTQGAQLVTPQILVAPMKRIAMHALEPVLIPHALAFSYSDLVRVMVGPRSDRALIQFNRKDAQV